MTKALGDILGNKWAEPPEIGLIKAFVADKYHIDIQVVMHPEQITLVTSNSALAGTLRMELSAIQTAAQTKKRLVIRIGH